MSEIQNNKGSISGSVEGTGRVNGGNVVPQGTVNGGVVARNIGGTRDYEMLENLPSINNTTLIGNYDEIDPTVPSWAKNETKPEYTYSEVGAVGGENQVHYEEIDRMFNAVFGL